MNGFAKWLTPVLLFSVVLAACSDTATPTDGGATDAATDTLAPPTDAAIPDVSAPVDAGIDAPKDAPVDAGPSGTKCDAAVSAPKVCDLSQTAEKRCNAPIGSHIVPDYPCPSPGAPTASCSAGAVGWCGFNCSTVTELRVFFYPKDGADWANYCVVTAKAEWHPL